MARMILSMYCLSRKLISCSLRVMSWREQESEVRGQAGAGVGRASVLNKTSLRAWAGGKVQRRRPHPQRGPDHWPI